MDKIIEFLYKLHLFLIIIILIDKIRLRFEGNIMKQRDIQVLIISANHDIEKMLKKVSYEFLQQYALKFETHREIIIKEFDFIIIEDDKHALSHLKELKNCSLYDNKPVLIVVEKKKNLASFIEMGVHDYLVKPLHIEELKLKVKSYLIYISVLRESKNSQLQFDALLNNTPYMAWFKNTDSQYIKVNREFREHSGKDDDVIFGRDDSFVWDGKIGKTCREYDLIVMNERRQIVFEEVIPGKKGYREFNIYKAPVVDELDEVIGTIGIARDVTELRNKDAKLQMILENIPFAICLKELDGTIIDVNSKFMEYYNKSRESIVGYKISELDKSFNAVIAYEDQTVIKEGCSQKFIRQFELRGEERIAEIYKAPVFDIANKMIGIVALMREVTEDIKTQEHIKRLAYTDFLTGLHNRRSLYKYIESEKAQLNLTVMFMDLDNFKKLNDSFGHHYGDEALLLISKKLISLCEDAFVARIGGDEFVVVWKNLNSETDLMNKINEILLEMKTEFSKGDKTNIISVSMGIVNSKGRDIDVDHLLLQGDLALYRAKEKGKNQFVIYTDDLEKERLFALELEMDLRDAIKNNEITLFYQPQYTCDKQLQGFEALFRWDNPKYQHVSIIDIIKMIEECRMIDEIGDYIIEHSCRFAKKVNEYSTKLLVVSMNISALQIMNHNFVDKFKSLIEKVGVSPSLIGIEITETVLMENMKENTKKLKALKALGVKISLDDFGTGYSSLNYLVHLPLSQVKIDQSFVRGMSQGEEFIRLVKLIVNIAHTLSLPVVAEGVEYEEDLKLLQSLKIDYIQGYYFSKPVCEEEALKLI